MAIVTVSVTELCKSVSKVRDLQDEEKDKIILETAVIPFCSTISGHTEHLFKESQNQDHISSTM